MKQSFSINFNYPFRDKGLSIELTGNATLHHSIPHYVISDIRFAKHPGGRLDALPVVKVQQRDIRGEKVWVHADTQKESELSRIIGEAIDRHLSNNSTNQPGQ
jgi:hypothetical protein